MGIGPGSGKGGARRGAGRKPKNPAKGRAQELEVLVQGIIAGLKLSALKFAPDGSDDELLQITVAGIAADEVARGRGVEIVKLLSGLLPMLRQSQADNDGNPSGHGAAFDLVNVMSRLPGINAVDAAQEEQSEDEEDEEEDGGYPGMDVRVIAERLRAGVGRQGGVIIPGPACAPASAFGPPQIELFDDLAPGALVVGMPH